MGRGWLANSSWFPCHLLSTGRPGFMQWCLMTRWDEIVQRLCCISRCRAILRALILWLFELPAELASVLVELHVYLEESPMANFDHSIWVADIFLKRNSISLSLQRNQLTIFINLFRENYNFGKLKSATGIPAASQQVGLSWWNWGWK